MATTRVPVEVYLSSSYEPDAKYVEGEIEERPMGEDDHSAWQDAVYRTVVLNVFGGYKVGVPHLRRSVLSLRILRPSGLG